MKKLIGFLLFFSFCLSSWAGSCSGRVINPITDVCWDCLFPIQVMGVRLSSSGVNDPITDAEAICTCGSGAQLRLGVNLSFFEPIRTAEIVREPWCFPSLGGISITGPRAPAHGRSSSRNEIGGRNSAFYQVHWYHTPWLFVLETILDTSCLEQSAWDLAYMTELDPFWDDAWASFVLAPEAALFASLPAVAACATDCAAAAAGTPRPELFWCAGCQGSLYPLAGWAAAATSHAQAWHLLSQRMTVKLAREGILWATYGKRGQCGPYFEPIPRKDVWRSQLIYPTVNAKGPDCCQPFGAPIQPWIAGRTFPGKGENGALLLWRKRDCCQTTSPTLETSP